MEFLTGKKEEFLDFLSSITKEDNVAILTHTDLDGISSGIFLEKILASKGVSVKMIEFIQYKNEELKRILPKLKQNNISKIFISDVSIDDFALEAFETLRNKMPVFLIDHHPINPLLKNKKNVIKAKSEDCASFVIYSLGKGLIDENEWKTLICATMIAEFSYKSPDNLKFIQNIYPNITKENILKSVPAKIYEIISSALIYHENDLRSVYDLVSKKEIKKLEKYYDLIQFEIKKETDNFNKNAEYYNDKKLYFYYLKSKYSIKSVIATNLSIERPDYSFVLISDDLEDKNLLNASARNQSRSCDMNLLLKKGIVGLKNANAGGHIPAAGASFEKKDLNVFKENLLK